MNLSSLSRLEGRWTCLAGINGSGKTAVLQAIALVLLGDKLAEQLGSVRLARMNRQVGEDQGHTEIRAVVRAGEAQRELFLPLSADGVDSTRMAEEPYSPAMRALWERRARRQLLLSYGASRNLSEYVDNRHEPLHMEVQRQMTLFDPLARVASARVLLSEVPAPVLSTLRRLLEKILADLPLEVVPGDDVLQFKMGGAVLPPTALPDGFRSTIAWLADLCAAWHDKAQPNDLMDGDPAHIRGIVLVDEIDLHLHPSLQRLLVPRLRAAIPHVQWIVTTHSPLVLTSFDRHELVVLDAAAPSGLRMLDRDIIGFTTDQVYDWLMDTPPRGTVLEEMLKKADELTDTAARADLAALVAQSPDFNEDDARKRVAWRKQLLNRLKTQAEGQPGQKPAGNAEVESESGVAAAGDLDPDGKQ